MIIMRCNLTWRPIVLSVLILGFISGFQNAKASPSAQEISQSQAAGKRNEYAVLKYLVPALGQAEKVGRIYYAPSSCVPDEDYPDPFPKINVQPPSKSQSGLASVREIFQGDKNVEVEEKPSGIIRIRIGKVPEEILQTPISRITLDSTQQYNPGNAIGAIRSSEEVRAAMQRLGIHHAHWVTNRGVAEPAPGLPHLSDSLTSLTMEQALDQVAQTFRGIVVYGTCKKLRLYTIHFTGGPGFDLSHQ